MVPTPVYRYSKGAAYRFSRGASPWLPQRVWYDTAPLIGVYNFNLASPDGWFPPRVRNIASRAAELDYARGKVGDIFALVESYYTTTGGGLGGYFGPITSWEKQIHCGGTGHPPAEVVFEEIVTDSSDLKWTAECFLDSWKSRLDSLDSSVGNRVGQPIHGQFGDAAILTHDKVMSLTQGYFTYVIDDTGNWGAGKRYMIGGRFGLKRLKDLVLPFYSVHLTPNGLPENKVRQVESCQRILQIAHENFVVGDLPPLIVGDLNFKDMWTPYDLDFDPEADAAYGIMNQDFFEVTHQFGERTVEHFWVGRSSRFPGCGGTLSAVENSLAMNLEFKDGSTDFTDHPCPYVEIAIRVIENPT